MRLSSGSESDWYVDCKQTLLQSEATVLVGQLVCSAVDSHRSAGRDVRAVGGLTMGADPLAIAAAAASWLAGRPVDAICVRKEPKSHGSQLWVEGATHLPEGAGVLVLEDVITTGASALTAVERLRDAGLLPVGVWAMVDRGEGGAERIRSESGLLVEALYGREDLL